MSRSLLCLSLPFILLACQHDIGLHFTDKTEQEYEDTASIFADDTASFYVEMDTATEEIEDANDEGSNPQPSDEPIDESDPPDDDSTPPAPEDDCDNTSDLIYAIDSNTDDMYLFNPISNNFEFLGNLDCGMFVTPESMSVARDGYAYIRSGTDVYQVNVETLECQPTTFQSANFGSFGMGFSTLSSNTWEEELFIANGSTLARLNTQTWSLQSIGNVPSQSELTGNASGELWAFFPLETPARLSHMSRSDAHEISSINLPQFPNPYDIDTFAFATWNGDFYLFVRVYGMGESTDVYRVQPNGTMTKVVDGSGLNVVGAGVSTCAPE